MGLLSSLFGGGQQPLQAQTAQQPAQGGGVFSGRLGILNDPSVALPLAGALMQPGNLGSNLGQGFALAGQGLEYRKKLQQEQVQQNMTAKYLESQGADPALVEMAKSGGGAQALQAWQQTREKPLDELRLKTAQLQLEKLQNPEASAEEYFGTPVYGVDANGKKGVGQYSKSGHFKLLDLPEGFVPSTGIQTIDTGTGYEVRDRRSGQVVDNVNKDLAGAEAQKAMGEQQGKSAAAAPADAQAAQNALDTIDSLRTDPNRERGTGKSAFFNGMPATGGYDFQTKVDQAKSGAFLTAIQQMRGMGSLSNAEGDTATKAVTRMNTATTEQGFLDALDDYEKVVRQGLVKAQSRMKQIPGIQAPQGAPQAAPQSNATSTGVQWKVLP